MARATAALCLHSITTTPETPAATSLEGPSRAIPSNTALRGLPPLQQHQQQRLRPPYEPGLQRRRACYWVSVSPVVASRRCHSAIVGKGSSTACRASASSFSGDVPLAGRQQDAGAMYGNAAEEKSPPDGFTAVLSKVNDLTKWAVSAAAFAVLLARRDAAVAWCVLGAIIASFLNKALKYIINQQRPPSARKADPGMPSSHANSLAFLGVYTARAVGQGAAPLSAAGLGAAAIVSLSVFLTWLRVRLGYHTTPQVVVGYGLGAATAAGWHELGSQRMLAALAAAPEQRMALYGCTALAVALFAVRNVLAWYKEREGGRSGVGTVAAKAA